MEERRTDIEPLPETSVRVDLKLQSVVQGRALDGCLVVHQRKGSWYTALVVKDHVGAPAHRDAVEVKLERTLGLPDATQIRLVLRRVSRDQTPGGVLELAMRHLVRRGQEEARVEDRVDL